MAFRSHAILNVNTPSRLGTFYEINNNSIGTQNEIPNAWPLVNTQYLMQICQVTLAHSKNSTTSQYELNMKFRMHGFW